MRKMFLTSVATFGLAFAPSAFTPAAFAAEVFAQTNGATQNPPSANAYSQMPQPFNSAPVGAMVPAQAFPSGSLGRTVVAQNTVGAGAAVPPTSAYRGGVGSPLSTQATDLAPSRGEKIGSRLPMPRTAGDTPRDLLAAAQRSLDRGQTGAAQQALEMAETRVLSRTTDPSMANQPDQASIVANISQARQDLGKRDIAGARQAITMALNDRVPPPGPATDTVPAGMPAMMSPPGAPMPRTY